MNNPTAETRQNGIHYTLHGDYYLPDLDLPEKASAPIGRYGRMRKSYLEKHRPGLYERLFLQCKLYEHLSEIDACCAEQLELTIQRMPDAEGIAEELKAWDQPAGSAMITEVTVGPEGMTSAFRMTPSASAEIRQNSAWPAGVPGAESSSLLFPLLIH